MPCGLAGVTRGRLSAAVRAGGKSLLCAVIAVAAVLSPWESRLLPEPVHYFGAAEAQAQTPPPMPFIIGDPEPCPEDDPIDWSPQFGEDGFDTLSECVLELPACPVSDLFIGQFMRPSVPTDDLIDQFPDLDLEYRDLGLERYPNFCEERVLNAARTQAEYVRCLASTGVVIEEYFDTVAGTDVEGCRLIAPMSCPAGTQQGTQQVTARTCRGVMRRTWTCTLPDDMPRNEFNTCYREINLGIADHPACGLGAPPFEVGACNDYVGLDVAVSPGADCATAYSTDTPVVNSEGVQVLAMAPTISLNDTMNNYWCRYDSKLLRAGCHRTDSNRDPDCPVPVDALCLRRASQAGGCDAVAQTIRCRAYEAAWRQRPNDMTLAEVRLNGCSPCHVHPFQNVRRGPPLRRGCPRDLYAAPRVGRRNGRTFVETVEQVELHNREDDNGACTDPLAGHLTWSPTHSSGLAVVNSAVLAIVAGIRLDWDLVPKRHRYSNTEPYTFIKQCCAQCFLPRRR